METVSNNEGTAGGTAGISNINSALLANHLNCYSAQVVRQNNLLLSRGVVAVPEVAGCHSYWRFQYLRFEDSRFEDSRFAGNLYQYNKVNNKPTCWVQLSHDQFILKLCYLNDQWQQHIKSRHWQDFSNKDQPLSFTLSHEAILQHLQSLFGVPWQVDAINHEQFQTLPVRSVVSADGMPTDKDVRGTKRSMAWRWKTECDGHTAEGIFLLDDLLLAQLTSQPVWQRVNLPAPSAIKALPVGMEVHIDIPPISRADLSAFTLGDVLVGSASINNKVAGFLLPKYSDTPFWSCQINLLSGECQLQKIYSPALPDEDNAISQPGGEQFVESNSMADILVVSGSPNANNEGDITDHMYKNLTQSDPNSSSKEQQANPSQDKLTNSLNSLPVNLSFQLAETPISLGELEQLQDGHIFKLDTPIEGTSIKVIANSKIIARGELVMIGEYFGVRLTELV